MRILPFLLSPLLNAAISIASMNITGGIGRDPTSAISCKVLPSWFCGRASARPGAQRSIPAHIDNPPGRQSAREDFI